MREITVKLYQFNELSEKAKKYAVEKYAWDDSYNDLITENMEEILFDSFPDAEVNWSLSCCQGDGASFTGKWTGKELEKIIELAYKGNIPRQVKRILKLRPELELKRISHRYVHEYTVQTNLVLNCYNQTRICLVIEQIEKVIDSFRVDLCKQLEKAGYKDIEYYSSAECFAEECESNEWEFTEKGVMQ